MPPHGRSLPSRALTAAAPLPPPPAPQTEEKLPYSFFVEDQELAAELGAHLLKHKVGTWRVTSRHAIAAAGGQQRGSGGACQLGPRKLGRRFCDSLHFCSSCV